MNKYKFYGLHILMLVTLSVAWLCFFGTQLFLTEMYMNVPIIEFKRYIFSLKFLFGGGTGEVLFNLLIGPASLGLWLLIRKKKFIHCYFILWFFLSLLSYQSYYATKNLYFFVNYSGGGGCGCGGFFTYLNLLSFSFQAGILFCLHAYLFYTWRKSVSNICLLA